MRGLSIIRGQPVLVIALGSLLGVSEAGSDSRFVTLRIEERAVALLVDGVLGFRDVRGSLSDLPPLLRKAASETVEAISTSDQQLLLVLKAGRLLPEGFKGAVPAKAGS